MPLAANPLIDVTVGLMIWTLVCFGITFFVLRRYAFGPVQRIIGSAAGALGGLFGWAEFTSNRW